MCHSETDFIWQFSCASPFQKFGIIIMGKSKIIVIKSNGNLGGRVYTYRLEHGRRSLWENGTMRAKSEVCYFP